MTKKTEDPITGDFQYICSDCAEDLGGVWPEGHVATFHEAKCDCCHKTAGLANIGDWNWPDGRRRGMRD